MSQESAFHDAVDALRARRPRYAREAYAFVVAALNETVRGLPAERFEVPERRHLSGRELTEGVVRLARAEFGSLAPVVFREWGVRATEDLGEIVFELVEVRQLSARAEDTRADFTGQLELLAALGEPAPPRALRGRPA